MNNNVANFPINEPVKRKDFPLKFLGDLKINLSNRWAVKGILPENGLAVIYGSPGSGKSFLTLSLTMHMVLGKEFAGKKVKRKGVVYISAEAGNDFENRAAATRDAMGLKKSDPFALLTVPPDLGKTDGDARWLIDTLYEQTDRQGWRAECIVVDTLARAAVGMEENSSRDMGIFVANCDMIAKEFEALVIAVHHSNKNLDLRGSNALLGAVHSCIEVSSDGEGLKTALIKKQKEGPDNLTFKFRLEQLILGQDPDGDDVTTCLVTDVSNLSEATPKPKKLGASIPASLRLWLTVFEEVLGDSGKMQRPLPDMPEVRAVDREAVRAAFYKRRGDESENSKRSAFNRGLNAATSQKLIEAVETPSGALLWKV